MSQSARLAIVWGGLLCGILDLTAAFIQFGLRGIRPIRIAQAIAAGLLGPGAFRGGVATASLGVALHFLIAFTAAAVYYLLSRRLTILVQRPLLAGLSYGVVVYCFMNYLVVPLSRLPASRFSVEALITGLIIHMLFVGLPIAYSVKRYSNQSQFA